MASICQQTSQSLRLACARRKALAQQHCTESMTAQMHSTRSLASNMQSSPLKNASATKAQDTQRMATHLLKIQMDFTSMSAKDTTRLMHIMQMHPKALTDNVTHWWMATMSPQMKDNICSLKSTTCVMQTAITSFLTPKFTM